MGYYNLPPTSYAVELSEFEKLLRSLPLEGAIQALDLLETLSRNVIQNPSEEKYRKVRTANEKLAPLFGLPGAADIMMAMGWQQEGDFMVLPKSTQLDFQQHIVKILEAKSHFGKQRENAARAAKLAADPNKADLLRQLELDRRERSGAAAAAAATEAASRLPIAVARPGPAAVPAAAGASPAAVAEPAEADSPAAATPAPAEVPAEATAEAAAARQRTPKSAFDFERREDREKARKGGESSLQELRALQKEKFKEFQADPGAKKNEAYQRPPSVANGAAPEAGWFDWLWGGDGGSSGSGGGGGGGNGRRGPPPGGPRVKTVADLPKPVRRGGG